MKKTIAATIIMIAGMPAQAKDFVPTPQMAGQGLQCGSAKIIVDANGKLQVTGLPYGTFRLTVKDDRVHLNDVPCVEIYCPGVAQGTQC